MANIAAREADAMASAHILFEKVYGHTPNMATHDSDAVEEMYAWLYDGDLSDAQLAHPDFGPLVDEWKDYTSYATDEMACGPQ